MPLPYLETDYGEWSPEGQSLRIEFAIPVIEEIAAVAVDGLCRFRHGGVEVGGVLYGRAGADTVRVAAYRPLPCEHAVGPRFVLSERDRASMRRLVEGPKNDPALKGLEPVGWYHSHTRSEIALSLRDREVYDSFFPLSRQIALVVRPDQYGPVRLGFFFREQNGSVRSESSYEEFVVKPRRHGIVVPDRAGEEETPEPATHASESEPSEAEPVPAAVAAEAPVAAAAPTFVTAPAFEREPAAPDTDLPGFTRVEPPRSRKWLWLALALIGAVGSGFGVERYYRLTAPALPLSLWVADMGGQLLIEWDRTSQPVRNAQRAVLEVRDGSDKVDIKIDGERLREGSVDYVRRSEIVDVRLRVLGADRESQEFIRFVGPPVQRNTTAEGDLIRQRDELKAEISKLQAQLTQKDSVIKQLRARGRNSLVRPVQ